MEPPAGTGGGLEPADGALTQAERGAPGDAPVDGATQEFFQAGDAPDDGDDGIARPLWQFELLFGLLALILGGAAFARRRRL